MYYLNVSNCVDSAVFCLQSQQYGRASDSGEVRLPESSRYGQTRAQQQPTAVLHPPTGLQVSSDFLSVQHQLKNSVLFLNRLKTLLFLLSLYFPLRYLPSLRTLFLHNNQLSFLSGAIFSSLPSLEEVSLHSNPLRCDCCSSWGPHLGNQSHLKILESTTTLCSSPHQLVGRELREVVAARWGDTTGGDSGTNSCLPQISPYSFPPAINVSAGQPITLECWADADPAPQFYWVTPTGDKVSCCDCLKRLTHRGGLDQ